MIKLVLLTKSRRG